MTGADDPADARWRWWRERRLPAERLYLDSAAAGRSSRATLAATAAHAEREATAGAYVAAAEAEPVLAEGRAGLAGLLGVPAAGVTFAPSAEAALDTLLAIWPLSAGNKQGDAVAVVPCEWGPNLHAFAARGLRITEITTHGDGAVDLAALERMLAGAWPAFVHLTHRRRRHPRPARHDRATAADQPARRLHARRPDPAAPGTARPRLIVTVSAVGPSGAAAAAGGTHGRDARTTLVRPRPSFVCSSGGYYTRNCRQSCGDIQPPAGRVGSSGCERGDSAPVTGPGLSWRRA